MKRFVAILLAVILVLSVSMASAVTYKKGSKGTAVKEIQELLNTGNYGKLKEDGVYGTDTVAAVKRYQKANGLAADGKCGPLTLASMGLSGNNNPLIPKEDEDGVMSKGSYGSDVKHVQQLLKSLGYPVGTADGKYGAKTVAAVKLFQSLNNLKVDGKVGTKTLDVLEGSPAPYNKKIKETTYTKLSYGSVDTTANKNAVTRLQKALEALGYLTSDQITGFYGADTKSAVAAFQADNGLTQDGIAGSATQSALYGQV